MFYYAFANKNTELDFRRIQNDKLFLNPPKEARRYQRLIKRKWQTLESHRGNIELVSLAFLG